MIVVFVVSTQEDITGDGVFDKRDVRLLLKELEE